MYFTYWINMNIIYIWLYCAFIFLYMFNIKLLKNDEFQKHFLTSFVHGPLTNSGFTTLAHLCWHWTSLRSGKRLAIMSHRRLVPSCSALLTSCFSKASCKKKSDEYSENISLHKTRKDESAMWHMGDRSTSTGFPTWSRIVHPMFYGVTEASASRHARRRNSL